MGRHRSTLRELGWGVSNSPNPWKQGSAKRVVRTLDYSQAEIDEPVTEPIANQENEKLNQLQQDGACFYCGSRCALSARAAADARAHRQHMCSTPPHARLLAAASSQVASSSTGSGSSLMCKRPRASESWIGSTGEQKQSLSGSARGLPSHPRPHLHCSQAHRRVGRGQACHVVSAWAASTAQTTKGWSE